MCAHACVYLYLCLCASIWMCEFLCVHACVHAIMCLITMFISVCVSTGVEP